MASGSSSPMGTAMTLYCFVTDTGISTVRRREESHLTSIADGCSLISLTKPRANALAADLRTNQWLRWCCRCSGLLAHESHQSR